MDSQTRAQKIEALVGALSAPTPRSEDAALLASDVSSLGISLRAENLLKANNMQTVGDVVGKTEASLVEALSGGSKFAQEVIEAVKSRGLSFEGSLYEGDAVKFKFPVEIADGNRKKSDDVFSSSDPIFSGTIIGFPTALAAQAFVNAARPLAIKDPSLLPNHLMLLPRKDMSEVKAYPVYVSDEALQRLTEPQHLEALSQSRQTIRGAVRG